MKSRIFALMGLLPVLGACAMPTGIAALSYAANGISYASSGKGVADHALSAAADKDCAMLRAVQGVDICASESKGNRDTLMTMIEPMPVTNVPGGAGPERRGDRNSMPDMHISEEQAVKKVDSSRTAAESIYGDTR